MQDKPKHTRYILNYFLIPKIQFTLIMWLVGLALVFIGAAYFYADLALGSLFGVLLQASNLEGALKSEIFLIFNNLKVIMIGLFLLFVLFMAFIIGFFTHRIIGPMIPIKRHVDNLLSGNYESKIILRKNDAFTDVAKSLNDLSDKLLDSQK